MHMFHKFGWSTVVVYGSLLSTAACYHATVDTGLAPSTQTVEKGWASGWVYGLVPPSTVETASKCPNGIARVSTQLTFPNQLVSFFTLGIYTPMEIVVTCAQTPKGTTAMQGATPAAAIQAAAEVSYQTQAPVYIEIGK
ncbi:MAG TPA: hypothetical protein VNU46_09200 [Gemmatimonadaceae bacterium]|jgi:hypothetical protein|nr:hypothetical protein [Gemmatimonadaceae bacterium]